MTGIVSKLQKTGSELIWCAITPVPDHELGRKKGDDVKYNAVVAEVMKVNSIRINDLHSHALKRQAEIQLKKGDVHFTKDGYKYLAEKVAAEISKILR